MGGEPRTGEEHGLDEAAMCFIGQPGHLPSWAWTSKWLQACHSYPSRYSAPPRLQPNPSEVEAQPSKQNRTMGRTTHRVVQGGAAVDQPAPGPGGAEGKGMAAMVPWVRRWMMENGEWVDERACVGGGGGQWPAIRLAALHVFGWTDTWRTVSQCSTASEDSMQLVGYYMMQTGCSCRTEPKPSVILGISLMYKQRPSTVRSHADRTKPSACIQLSSFFLFFFSLAVCGALAVLRHAIAFLLRLRFCINATGKSATHKDKELYAMVANTRSHWHPAIPPACTRDFSPLASSRSMDFQHPASPMPHGSPGHPPSASNCFATASTAC
ncbi:hypothetical protein B0I35DRAFT_107814 [Stachybotrys elegans]|uniref:Uncharacterized protein n=1 Tax=Stachybotrys elegans TaxID=80388 RepID=A0A8K0SHH7_9HYPO|nr:hypothetical protein B0I35DRAFT_107814 [Stachybotrys elegans]